MLAHHWHSRGSRGPGGAVTAAAPLSVNTARGFRSHAVLDTEGFAGSPTSRHKAQDETRDGSPTPTSGPPHPCPEAWPLTRRPAAQRQHGNPATHLLPGQQGAPMVTSTRTPPARGPRKDDSPGTPPRTEDTLKPQALAKQGRNSRWSSDPPRPRRAKAGATAGPSQSSPRGTVGG